MKIAVTGSSGLVGSALCRALAHAGHQVIRLVRRQVPDQQMSECWWDPHTGIKQLDKLAGVDACVHLAGRSIAERRWTGREKELIRSSRVEATRALCSDIARLSEPLKMFVSASAIGIYGDCGDRIIDDEVDPAELPLSTNDSIAFLQQTALDWEAASQPLGERGTRLVYARLGVVLSRRGGALAKMLPLFRWGLGSRLGSGQQYWSWIALEDVIRGLTYLLENEPASSSQVCAYNFVAPQPVTNAEFTRQLAAAVHRFQFVPVPEFALRMIVGPMADAALLASCRAVPKRLLQHGFLFQSSTLDQALASPVA